MTKSAANAASKAYAGLDVSLKETAICIVDDAGKIVFETMVPTDPKVIASCLAERAHGLERFGLESGSTSAWLWREFRQLGLPVVCLDSRHAHRVLSMKRNKNDRNDARGLADLVRMGWYREARVRSIDALFVRSLLLSRQQLLQSRRAIENQIRGALKTLGVMTSSTKGRGFMPRVVEMRADNEWLGPVLDPLLGAHASIAKQLKIVSASVLEERYEGFGRLPPFGRATLYRAAEGPRDRAPRARGLEQGEGLGPFGLRSLPRKSVCEVSERAASFLR